MVRKKFYTVEKNFRQLPYWKQVPLLSQSPSSHWAAVFNWVIKSYTHALSTLLIRTNESSQTYQRRGLFFYFYYWWDYWAFQYQQVGANIVRWNLVAALIACQEKELRLSCVFMSACLHKSIVKKMRNKEKEEESLVRWKWRHLERNPTVFIFKDKKHENTRRSIHLCVLSGLTGDISP